MKTPSSFSCHVAAGLLLCLSLVACGGGNTAAAPATSALLSADPAAPDATAADPKLHCAP